MSRRSFFLHRCGSPSFVSQVWLRGARLMPVTVSTFDTQRRCEGSKTMTVTRMATWTRLIPVTIDTFDMQRMYGRRCFPLTLALPLTLAFPFFESQMKPKTWPNAVIYNFCNLSGARNAVIQVCDLLRGTNVADFVIFIAFQDF